MSRKSLQDRLIENEAAFRQHNEQVQHGLEELKRQAKEEGLKSLSKDNDMPLHFYCECSDENCTKRIIIKPSEYAEIHRHRNRFITLSGHEVEGIECIVSQKETYHVVEKFADPPESANTLNNTPIDNS